jgi:hypothetical protein
MEKKKMKVHDALFIIGMLLADWNDECQLEKTEKEAWNRIREVVKNSYEYNEERESK